MINKQYSQQWSKDAVVIAARIKKQFGNIIAAACAVIGVPIDIIVGFIVIESEGKADAVSPMGAIGMMQLTPETAYDTIKRQQKEGFDPQEEAIIKKYAPSILTAKKFDGTVDATLTKALKNYEFNIWVGVMCVGWLLKNTSSLLGDFRLDQVVIKYNAGIGNYHKYIAAKGLQDKDTTTIYQAFPFAETKSYILKFVGIKGSIEQSMRVNMDGSVQPEVTANTNKALSDTVNQTISSTLGNLGTKAK